MNKKKLTQYKNPLTGNSITPPLKVWGTTLYTLVFILIFSPMLLFSQNQSCNLGLPPEFTWEDENFVGGYQVFNGEVFEIICTIILEDNARIDFNNCVLNMAPDAKIIIKNQSSIYFEGSNLSACGDNIWDGIYLEYDGYLYATKSEFKDAMNTIYSTDNSNFDIIDNLFENNVTSLKVVDYNNDHLGTYLLNTISFNPQNAYSELSVYTNYGIYCENVVPATPGHKLIIGQYRQDNLFQRFFSGAKAVYLIQSDVHISYAHIDMYNADIGIYVHGSSNPSILSNVIIESVDIYNSISTSNNCIIGYYNLNIEIIGNTLRGAQDIINITTINGDVKIDENKIYTTGSNSKGLLFGGLVNSGIINGNLFEFEGGTGAQFQNTSDVTCTGNIFNGDVNGKGININDCNNISVSSGNNFNIENNGTGVIVMNASSNIDIIQKNVFNISDNAKGIDILNSNNITIDYENSFNFPNNGKGVRALNSNYIGIIKNEFEFTNYGNAIDIDNCDDAEIRSNNITSKNDFAIKTVNSDNGIITSNIINKTNQTAIYASYCSDIEIFDNDIDFPINMLTSKIGISVNNLSGNENFININNINMGSFYGWTPTNYLGIFLENSPNTDVESNAIYNCGRAISFVQDNSKTKVACNKMIDSEQGIYLNNATWGEPDLGFYTIGYNNLPYDNYWDNITQTDGRVKGSLSYLTHHFYYKTGTNYSLSTGQYNVSGNFNSFQATNPPTPGYCDNPINKVNLLSSSNVNDLSDYRDMKIGFVIDSNYLNTSLVSSSNPYGIYNDEITYNLIKNAYYHYKDNPKLSNLGLSSDAKYNNFELTLDQSNLGLNYLIDKNIKNNNINMAKNHLQAYQPNNLSEINAMDSYEKYIQYLETDSLSSQDSSLLLNIAYQNPLNSGQAVYIARNLMNLYIIDSLVNTSSSKFMSNGLTESELNNNSYIRTFPNPADDYLNISIGGDYNGDINYYIYSVDGRLINNGVIINKQLNKVDLSEFSKGIYLLEIKNNNKLIHKDKFVLN